MRVIGPILKFFKSGEVGDGLILRKDREMDLSQIACFSAALAYQCRSGNVLEGRAL